MRSMARMRKTLEKLALGLALIPVIVFIFYITIPLGNTHASHFDVLMVLGYPANADGTPAPEQRERVLEAVRQFKSGVAPVILVSGAAAHNRFVEADVMAALAETSGVPPGAIVRESRALDTIQNIAYSTQIMRAHGWQSAEVVTSAAHVRRASLILLSSPIPIHWHMQASPWPREYGALDIAARYAFEALACTDMRLTGSTNAAAVGKLEHLWKTWHTRPN